MAGISAIAGVPVFVCTIVVSRYGNHHGRGSVPCNATAFPRYGNHHGRGSVPRNAAAVPRYRRQYIYEKHGFQEVKLDDYEYERGDIAFEYVVPR